MRKSLKTLAGLGLSVLCIGAAYALVSGSAPQKTVSREAKSVSATWTLGDKVWSDVKAAVTDADVITATNLRFEGATTNRVRTAKPSTGEIKLTTWNSSMSATRVESDYVAFTATTVGFQPSQLTLNWGAIKTGNARVDIEIVNGENVYTVATAQVPARVEEDATKDAATEFSASFDITEVPAITGDLEIRFYLYGDAGKAREVGFNNVTISGLHEEGEVAPDECFFHIPGTLPVPDTKDEVNYGWGGNMNIEGNDGDKNFSNTYEGSSITFKNVHVHQPGGYQILMPLDWATGNGAKASVEVTDAETGVLEAKGELVSPKNNTAWEKIPLSLDGVIAAGMKNVKIAFTPGEDRNFAFNMKAPEFVRTGDGTPLGGSGDLEVPAGWMTFPGDIDIDHNSWTYSGLRVEGGGANIGYAKNGCYMEGQVFVKEAGVYNLNVNFNWFQNPGQMQIEITDQATGVKEIDTYYAIPGKHVANILLEGELTPGKKTIRYTMHSESSGFIANFTDHTATKVADHFAILREISFDGGQSVEFEGFDYCFNIPMSYNAATVKLQTSYQGGELSARLGDEVLTIAADGSVEVPTPAAGASSEITFTLAVAEGSVAPKTEFKVRLYHIGNIEVTNLTLDGMAISAEQIEALNKDKKNVSIDGYIFTSVPVATVYYIDGTSAVVEGKAEGGKVVYAFNAGEGDSLAEFSFNLSGLHIYTPSAADKTTTLRYDSSCKGKGPNGEWSDGLYSLTANDGWDGTQFKMRASDPITLTTPTDMKIKQLVLSCLRDNYTAGRVKSITCEGATVYAPSASAFATGVDNDHSLNYVVNVENHTPGAPFVITFEGGSQPVCWFDFVYETIVPADAPSMVGVSSTSVADRNHAVVTFNFNRAMKGAEITVNGAKVEADGGKTSLKFSIWDLPYNADVEVVIPAGAAEDIYGNKTDKDYSMTLKVGDKAIVKAFDPDHFIAVTDVEDLRAAVAGLSKTNGSRDAARTVIFLLNGDYDLGSTALGINKVYNVSLIGESQEGVLIHGTQDGISYPVVSTRYSANVYVENLTIRNDLDFGKAERVGVGVAHYGGELDIFKNVTLQSIQDTEVSGDRGYWLNCTIHGSVDYICGGGDHFFDNCLIKHEIAGGYITAPSTAASNKYGYVFHGCTIDGVGPYDLGRPWHNEPRTFFINTTMNVLPNDAGWGKMGDLVTHFYEYGSKDSKGNMLDLSKRKNSPTSLNTYSPILDEKYIPYFTTRNVLGGDDSFDAKEMTSECEAPVATLSDAGVLSWNAVEGAAGYLIFINDQFAGFTDQCEYAPISVLDETSANVRYRVAAVNANGARGVMSESISTGVEGIEAAEGMVEYYNLQGLRVDPSAEGVVIRLTRNADGTVKAEKLAK